MIDLIVVKIPICINSLFFDRSESRFRLRSDIRSGLGVVPLFRGIEVRGRSLCRSLLSRVASSRNIIGICLCVNKP